MPANHKVVQVVALWGETGRKPSASLDCDSWGLRKFMSHFVKRFTQTTCPRNEKVRHLKRVLMQVWAPHRLEELDQDPDVPLSALLVFIWAIYFENRHVCAALC